MQSVAYADAFSTLASDFNLLPLRSVTATVSIELSDSNFDDYIILQVTANGSVRRAVSVKISRGYTGPHLLAEPSFLNVSSSMTSANENVEVSDRRQN